MATKDITDVQVVQAYADCNPEASRRITGADSSLFPYDLLMQRTGLSFKECYAACERACKRGYIDWGVSLRTGWVEDKGRELLAEAEKEAGK